MHSAARRPKRLTPTGIGPLGKRWPGVERVVVLRGGGLGDLLSVLPAIDALRAAYANADIVVLCAPNNVALLNDRPSPVSRAVGLPMPAACTARATGPAKTCRWTRFGGRSLTDR